MTWNVFSITEDQQMKDYTHTQQYNTYCRCLRRVDKSDHHLNQIQREMYNQKIGTAVVNPFNSTTSATMGEYAPGGRLVISHGTPNRRTFQFHHKKYTAGCQQF